jgi:hypothetical protein
MSKPLAPFPPWSAPPCWRPPCRSPPGPSLQRPDGRHGRWAIDLSRSKFNAALTGPPPLSGELDVTIDDGKALAWTLVEVDEAGVAALQFAHAVLDGPPTRPWSI